MDHKRVVRRSKFPRLKAAALLSLTMPCVHATEFASFRYDDNFIDRALQTDAYSQLKHVDLGEEDRYLSMGGDWRERFEYFSHSNIGTHAADYDSFLLHRLLFHIDTHWDQFRVFAQLGNFEEFGRQPHAKLSDVDHLDVRQLFIDYRMPVDSGELTLRGGRQELAFGASRLVTARDGPNIRLDFDGINLQFANRDWKVNAIAVRPAQNTPASFDDKAERAQSLWGIYATHRFTPSALRSDLYYFGAINEGMRFDSITGDEHRSTFGLRLYGTAGAFDSDIELMLQDGHIGDQTIRAFALATDSGWSWRDYRWAPRLGLRTDIISGDRNRRDHTLGTFNALYPNGSYFSEASVLAQANLLDFAVSISLKPWPDISLTASANPLWRYSVDDAVYTLPLAPLIAGNTSDARYIGTQNQILATWQYTNFVSFKAALVKFNAGDFVQRAGGRDLDYAQLSTSLRF